jgi:hypothetical protein
MVGQRLVLSMVMKIQFYFFNNKYMHMFQVFIGLNPQEGKFKAIHFPVIIIVINAGWAL